MSELLTEGKIANANIETLSFIDKLENWAKERSKSAERRVREQIVKAVRTDLESKVSSKDLERIKKYQADVDRMINFTINKLQINYPNGVHSITTDSETGNPFSIHIRYDPQNNCWIAEEVNIEGKPISRSIIFDDPSRLSEVTLTFVGGRYAQMHGELNEIRTDIPTAAKVMFLDQAANLGVIDWPSPIRSTGNIINPILTKTRNILSGWVKK